jgi:aryl-alcohol dehydrogenase-like predicted oxidoreductase
VQYRKFGNANWLISEIALARGRSVEIGARSTMKHSIKTLLYAFEKGINFVDTAELYGHGHHEEVIGRALKQWRGGQVYIATKVQPVVWPDPDDHMPLMRGRYPEWYLRDAVEKSLKRLQVERIDLLQLHCWLADGVKALDWLETLNALRVEGKIDRIGVSIRDYRPEEGLELAKLGLLHSIQVVFNLFEQRPAGPLFEAGAVTGTGMIARVPLDSGALTGTWTAETYNRWEEGSVPRQLFRGERFAQTLERIERLKALCKPYYPTLAEAAMRYVLSAPEFTTVIPGMTSPAQIDMNIAYSDGAAFPEELKNALAAHNWPRNFYK